MQNLILLPLLLIALSLPVRAQDTNSVYTTERDQVSYAIGYNVGMNLQRQQYEVNPDIIAQGIRDVLEDSEKAMTETTAREVLQAYQQKLFKKRQEEQAAEAAENKKAGTAWLEENAKKEGVVATESGLQYKVLTQGDGDSPASGDTVKVNYRGTLIDGTEFDSSYSRGQPAQFRVTGVIRGWTEALQLMKTGGKWQLFIPADLAYGDRPQGAKIKPGSTLIFEIELLEVIKPQPVTSDIIKVPSAEEMKKGAKIETIKASDLKRIEEEARQAKEQK
jgi:FKBP-type peptidyl-prolyl cis-trans isomerase FklB